MIFDSIQQTLNEFFVDVTEENVVFHLGDLFDPSQFRLKDVFLRTELLNSLHLPFEIKGGYIGDVKIEGFVGLVTGSPLNIALDNIVLVVGHKPVDWDNELVTRYAKELLIAMLQSFSNPSHEGKQKKVVDDSSMSPAKWIMSKMQAALADTTIKLERIHIRFESEQEGSLIAYGVHIPTIQVTTRDMNDQILHRRDQLHGITYPKEGEDSASKLVYCANSSIYCDLNATSYVTPPTSYLALHRPSCAASLARNTPSSPKKTKLPPLPPSQLLPNPTLAYFRTQCHQPFKHDPDRDLIMIAAWWFKVDVVRSKQSQAWVLAALDIVTETITVNADFAQLTALTDEMERITEFFERTKRQSWRPSCIDRERVAPPCVTLSSTLLLPRPLGTGAVGELLPFGLDKQRRTRDWLRGMWRYATRCVLYTLRKGRNKRVKLFNKKTTMDAVSAASLMMQQQRYVDLHRRSLDQEALKIIVDGRALNSKSPKSKKQVGTTATVSTNTTCVSGSSGSNSNDSDLLLLPQYPPLSLQEQWEYSDMVQTLPIYEQRVFRSMAASMIRSEMAALASLQASSPKRSNSSKKRENLTLAVPPTPLPSASTSTTLSSSPTRQEANIPTTQPPTAPKGFPSDFVANHQHQFSRSLTESTVLVSPRPPPLSLPNAGSTSPTRGTSPRVPPPLTHAISTPTFGVGKTSPTASPTRSLHSPQHAFSKQQWFLEALLPPALLAQATTAPLLNWHIGEIAVRFHHRESVVAVSSSSGSPSTDGSSSNSESDHDSFVLVGGMVPVDPSSPKSPRSRQRKPRSTRLLSKRSTDSSMLMHLESCTGSILFCAVPSVSFLIEVRLGRFHIEVCSSTDPTMSPSETILGAASSSLGTKTYANAITTDYILGQPTDGFMYLGLKYGFKPPHKNTSFLAEDEPQWDVKAKLCVGAIHISYNEMALHTALRTADKVETLASIGRRCSGNNLGNSDASPQRRPSCSSGSGNTRIENEKVEENEGLSSIRIESATHFTLIQDVLSNWKAFLQRVRPNTKLKTKTTSIAIAKKKKAAAAASAFVIPSRKEEEAAQARATKHARLTKLLSAVMQQCSLVEADVSGMELRLSMLTSHVERVLDVEKTQALLYDSEEVTISLPPASAGLQNRPLLNECQVHAGGASIKFRTTKQGRAAVIDHVLKRFDNASSGK